MPIRDYKYILSDSQAMTTAAYSTDEANFGFANPFYGRGGKFGLHVLVVSASFTGADSGVRIWIVSGAATAPTTQREGRKFTAAQLTLGKHYFIPGGLGLLQYARGYWEPVSEAGATGSIAWWFGPDEDGAE